MSGQECAMSESSIFLQEILADKDDSLNMFANDFNEDYFFEPDVDDLWSK